MIRDDVAVHNERAKLLAGFLNALWLALIGVGVLAPLVARGITEGVAAPSLLGPLPEWPGWLLVGLAMHGSAHYILGYLKKVAPS